MTLVENSTPPDQVLLAKCSAKRWIRLLSGLKAWRADYLLAREAWRVGQRKAIFPYGTYWQRVFHKAKTRGSPSAPLAA